MALTMPRPKRKRNEAALCHPDRRVARLIDGLCHECVCNERAVLRGIERIDPTIPRRIDGVVHRALGRIPTRCPHCEAPNPSVYDRLVSCLICGATYYLIVERQNGGNHA